MISRTFTPRILVVDDDLDTLGLIRMVLKRAGYDVTTASRWEEVTDRLEMSKEANTPFDLVILDIMMPGHSGYDVFRAMEVVLRKMPPVIFLSAKNTVDAMVTASELGAAKYLTKPTTPEKLLDAVRNVLNRAR
ncbi:MAG TPA: response regulator transcription factor [Anaerolineales bacterium]|nr:response regulator transcription factor [Anaerolineales bacterium]